MSANRTKHRCALLIAVILVSVLSPPAMAAAPEPVFSIGVPEPAASEAEGYDEFDSLTWKASEVCVADVASLPDNYFPAALYAPALSPNPSGVSELVLNFSLPEACSLVLRLYRYGLETDCVEFNGKSFAAAGPGEGLWGEVVISLGAAGAGEHTLRFTVVPGQGDGIHFWDAIVLERAVCVATVTWLPPVAIEGKAHSPGSTLPLKFTLALADCTGPLEVAVLVTDGSAGSGMLLAATPCENGTCFMAHLRVGSPGTYTATVIVDGTPAGDPVTFVAGADSPTTTKLKTTRMR